MKQRLCILCGGKTPEHEISLLSARNVVAAVDRGRYDIILVGIDKAGGWSLFPADAFTRGGEDAKRIALADGGVPLAPSCRGGAAFVLPLEGGDPIGIDIAFPVMHGTYGEDGAIQGLLRMLGIPVVGCDLASSANCMDKETSKILLGRAGIHVARAVMADGGFGPAAARAAVRELGLPVFVKPARMGSSVGVSRVNCEAELEPAVQQALRFDTKALVEEYVAGREIECAVLGNREPRASLPGEIIPVGDDHYSFLLKYIQEDGAALVAPAHLDQDAVGLIQETAIAAFRALSCSGMARVDFFLKADGTAVVNELNTIPGFTRISMYPKLWDLSGVSYPALVQRLIDLARERFEEENALTTDYTTLECPSPQPGAGEE